MNLKIMNQRKRKSLSSEELTMSRYLVRYIHPNLGSILQNVPEHWGIADIKNGFWVGDSGEVNPLSDDAFYWVPISQVQYVMIKETK